jgi:ABC-type Fe3+-hydroxamate transport system substrate-binding protein
MVFLCASCIPSSVVKATGTEATVQETASGDSASARQTGEIRIVSLTLASDEILTALVRIREERGALDKSKPAKLTLQGLSTSARSADSHVASILGLPAPDAFTDKIINIDPRVPSLIPAHAEPVIASDPSHVIFATYNHPSLEKNLRDAGIQTLKFETPTSLVQVESTIQRIGNMVGYATEAVCLINKMRARMAHTQARLAAWKQTSGAKPHATRALAWSYGYTHGQATLLGEIMSRLQLENVAASANVRGIARVPKEALYAWAPEVIVVTSGDLERNAIATDPELANVRVIAPAPRDLGSISQFAACGMHRLAETIYPRMASAPAEPVDAGDDCNMPLRCSP